MCVCVCVCVCTANEILFSHKKKKNEILLLATTWMDLAVTTLNEICQKDEKKYHMISPICVIQKPKQKIPINTQN